MSAVPDLRQQLANEGGMGTSTINYVWPLIEAWGDARVAAAQAETKQAVREARYESVGHMIESSKAINDELRRTLRQLHWMTLGSDADGTLSGKPVCGCCAWLAGIRRPWPCDSLRAVGFTDDDAAAALARSVPGMTEGQSDG